VRSQRAQPACAASVRSIDDRGWPSIVGGILTSAGGERASQLSDHLDTSASDRLRVR
jgi:hypothetical protein